MMRRREDIVGGDNYMGIRQEPAMVVGLWPPMTILPAGIGRQADADRTKYGRIDPWPPVPAMTEDGGKQLATDELYMGGEREADDGASCQIQCTIEMGIQGLRCGFGWAKLI
jgi:hypothetical protein